MYELCIAYVAVYVFCYAHISGRVVARSVRLEAERVKHAVVSVAPVPPRRGGGGHADRAASAAAGAGGAREVRGGDDAEAGAGRAHGRRRLRELLLLALRVAALLLLRWRLRGRFWPPARRVGSSGVTMVALDTSLSLSAPGSFERAKQLAKDAIGRAPAGDLVGVVTFADGPRSWRPSRRAIACWRRRRSTRRGRASARRDIAARCRAASRSSAAGAARSSW